MIGFFKRALTTSVSSNTVRANELELARRSLKIASSLLGTNLATTLAELRIVNLSRTVAESRLLAATLTQQGFLPRVLNGTQDEAEAIIVARAGEADAITVATDMAGRGTDIILADDVAACGGLHVIVTEPRHSPRLDRQLTGRCARQGQPGTSRTFVAADDTLLCQHGRGLSRYLARRLKPNAAPEPLWNAVTKAARKSESEMSIARARLAKRERQREEFISISDASPEPKT